MEKSLDEHEGELVRIVRPRSKSRRIAVDDMRALEKSFHVASAPGKWKIGVILHADRMGTEAENCLLLHQRFPGVASTNYSIALCPPAAGMSASRTQRDRIVGRSNSGESLSSNNKHLVEVPRVF